MRIYSLNNEVQGTKNLLEWIETFADTFPAEAQIMKAQVFALPWLKRRKLAREKRRAVLGDQADQTPIVPGEDDVSGEFDIKHNSLIVFPVSHRHARRYIPVEGHHRVPVCPTIGCRTTEVVGRKSWAAG
ncbi:hypothetical protein PM082_004761 [Marasmius tenuissimus]|nr:hypothetical protein PM082_004761 [Marasmius tenuissimus]